MGMPGRVVVKAVAAGTINFPAGATLFSITMHASANAATVTVGGGDAMPVINGANPTTVNFPEDNASAASVGGTTIVGVNTDQVIAIFKLVGTL